MAYRRVKRSENKIWDLGGVVTYIRGTFYLLVFKIILGSFGALVSKWPLTRKQLDVVRNGVKLETRV